MTSKVAYSTYREYLAHPRFRAIRNQVMRSAAGKCARCDNWATEVHHLRYPTWGEFDVPENLVALCHRCHCVIHGKEI